MPTTTTSIILLLTLVVELTLGICRSGQPSLSTRANTGMCMLQNSGCCTAANDTSINAQLSAFGRSV
jgi:hypothetical protein